jgi:hypothetical protein
MSGMTPLDAGFDLSFRGFGQASGWSPSAARRRGFVEQSSDEDYVDDDGEDQDSDGDLDSGDSDYTWLERDDFSSNRHHAQN